MSRDEKSGKLLENSVDNMTPILQKLISQFQFLPGIGEKTAQRFSYYIFSRQKEAARQFASTLIEALDNIVHCSQCRNLSETPVCHLCTEPDRDNSLLCIVEHPSNIQILETTQSYKGRYFVLHGALSPIDGITPYDLGLNQLSEYIKESDIQEIIVATSSKVEGEATAYYIYDQFKDTVKVSRLASGMPMGGTLDYIDGQTLKRALRGRSLIDD